MELISPVFFWRRTLWCRRHSRPTQVCMELDSKAVCWSKYAHGGSNTNRYEVRVWR